MMTKSSQRLLFVSALMFFICAMHLLLAGDDDNEHGQRYIPLIGRCTDGERAAWASEWNVTERNHGDLLDDRFTYGFPLSLFLQRDIISIQQQQQQH